MDQQVGNSTNKPPHNSHTHITGMSKEGKQNVYDDDVTVSFELTNAQRPGSLDPDGGPGRGRCLTIG